MSAQVLVICGPTASGKSALAVALAKRLNGEVVSADSMQVYRRMDVGTAKPTPEEMDGVPHHMLDVADPEEDYSAARYVMEASRAVDGILSRDRLPIVAGGTGLYIDSLLAGRAFAPLPADRAVREELYERARTAGLPAMYDLLRASDPETASRVHPNDERRILRALEVYLSTGRTMSEFVARTRLAPRRYEALTLALAYRDRDALRARIDARVDRMMERGLEREVRALLQSGVPERATAMQAIGYRQLAAAIRTGGSIPEAVEEVKLRSRQYAKRQLTWFRREEGARWLHWEDFPTFSDALQFSTALALEAGL